MHSLDIWNILQTGARMECALEASVREKEGVYLPSSFLSPLNHWLVLTLWEVNSPSLPGGSPSPFSGHSGCQISFPVVWHFIQVCR